MRKMQKDVLLDFISTLFEAHNEIKKYVRQGNLSIAMDLLGQCQDGAIKMGTTIEDSEGEDFNSIKFIEEYCEAVYRVYESLQSDPLKPANHSFDKILNKKLIKIHNSVKDDIPVKLEVVFLPYKASMWDSLESVWKAANADENCDAYVIPIPYYDKNSDGSFGQMNYEGELYPEYVPVTHYDEYDFKNRRPDMIYIHYPYDEHNIVTAVHPFFYSKNLKNYTEKLIYIPYFVLAEPDLGDEKTIEKIADFVVVSAVFNANKVIVQSENMRQAYIEVLVKETGEETRHFWEEKIDGSGSPKFDRIENFQEEDYAVPETWNNIIKRPDGLRKKIILYNTGVVSMIEKSEALLNKIEANMTTFKAYSEEIALLWRPHPLMEITLQHLRPGLWQRYRKIVDTYINEGWGIYDETPELARAIAISDAYYGDWSSVVQLYEKTKKPILIQSIEAV